MATGGKGIEWMLNLVAGTQGATDVVQALGETKGAADAAGASIDRSISKMDKLPKSIDTGEKHAQSLWKEVFKGELAFEAVKKGAEMAVEAIKKVGEAMVDAVSAAASSQRTDKVFENMLSKEGGKKTLEYLEKFSELSEFTDHAIKPMVASLLQVGVRGADFRNAIAAASDVAAASTDKFAGFSGAVESFTRIARTGRIDNRILAGLALNPHDVEAQLAKDLGMAPEVIKTKLEEGTLKGVEAMDSIFTVMEKRSGKQLGGLGEGMKDNLGARLEKLKDVPDEIFKKLKNTQGFNDISDSIERITGLLGPDSEVGKGLVSALGKALDEIGVVIKEIDWEKFSKDIVGIVDDLRGMIEPLKTVAELLGTVFKTAMYLPKIGRAIGDWAAESMNGDINQDSQRRHDEYLRKQRALSPHAQENAERAKGMEGIGENTIKGIDLGVSQSKLEDIGSQGMSAIDDGFTSKGEIHSPSRLFERHGQMLGEGLALGMESSSERLAKASGAMIPSVDLSGAHGAAGGGGSFTIAAGAFTFQINVGGAGESAQDVGKEAARQTSEMLLPMFEQFAIQAGLA